VPPLFSDEKRLRRRNENNRNGEGPLKYFRLFINTLSGFAVVASLLLGGAISASAKHDKTLMDHTLASLMGDLKVQVIKPTPLSEFSLPDIFGKNFKIQNQSGKVMLINFWTTH
jgi:hypothetical protein